MVLVVVGLAVVWTHAAPIVDHATMDNVAAVCLAVVGSGLALSMAAGGAAAGISAWPLERRVALPAHRPLSVRAVPARAGPAQHQVFRR